jgi:hypothetical protein
MSQLQLKNISKEIIDHAEKAVIPEKNLSKAVDDFFIQRLKRDEMEHAEVDPRLYEGLRSMVQTDVLPLYRQYREETARLRERRQRRKLWQYVLGTVAFLELLEVMVTRGRSIAPQLFIPSVILNSFIGFIIYTAAQYFDDLQLARARKRLERSLEGLETRVQTDVDYDLRRELLDADVLRAEALEIMTTYSDPRDFWRDYVRVRQADPTLPAEIKALRLPAFDRFLRLHAERQLSPMARQQRFNRLFIEAQEVFISRDRDQYVLQHLNRTKPAKNA